MKASIRHTNLALAHQVASAGLTLDDQLEVLANHLVCVSHAEQIPVANLLNRLGTMTARKPPIPPDDQTET